MGFSTEDRNHTNKLFSTLINMRCFDWHRARDAVAPMCSVADLSPVLPVTLLGAAVPVAAESRVPGVRGFGAGLLAGQAQRDALTVHSLQVAGLGRWLPHRLRRLLLLPGNNTTPLTCTATITRYCYILIISLLMTRLLYFGYRDTWWSRGHF